MNEEQVPLDSLQRLPEGSFVSQNLIIWPIRVRGGDYDTRLQAAVQERTMTVDGETQLAFVVKATGEFYDSKTRAIEMASKEVWRSMPEPEIGDVRIYFTETPCRVVSTLARQKTSNMLASWYSSLGNGHKIGMVALGEVAAQEMIDSVQHMSSIKTWTFRAGGWLLHFCGFSLLTSVISTAAELTLNWIPLVGRYFSSLIGFSLVVGNGSMATILTLSVVSFGWLFHRPLLSASILATTLGLFIIRTKA